MSDCKHNHRGSALITALFIVSIVAIAATAMSKRLQLDIDRTRTAFNADQLELAATAVTAWSIHHLLSTNPNRLTAIDEVGTLAYFPKAFAQIAPNIRIQGRLIDLQARFNLNNLEDKSAQTFWYALLTHSAPTLNSDQQRRIFQGIQRHLQRPRSDATAHRNALSFQPMLDASELRTIPGVGASLYQTLAPYITALPKPTPINIQTAMPMIIRCLGFGLNASQTRALLSARRAKAGNYTEQQAHLLRLIRRYHIPTDQISFESQYFLSEATVSNEQWHITVHTWLHRQQKSNKNQTIIIINQQIMN